MEMKGVSQVLRKEQVKGIDGPMAQLILSALALLSVIVTLTIQDYTHLNTLKWQILGGGLLGLAVSTFAWYLTDKVQKEEEQNMIRIKIDKKRPLYPNIEGLNREDLLKLYRSKMILFTGYFDEEPTKHLDTEGLKKAIITLYDDQFVEKSAKKRRENLFVLSLIFVVSLSALFTFNNDWPSVCSTVGLFGLTSFVGTVSLISLIYSSIKLKKDLS